MYNPEIGALYKSKEGEHYYKIVSFENPSMAGVKVGFQTPGKSNHTFEYKGLSNVSDFLYSIERVSSVPSELESLAEQETELKRNIAEIQSKREFLQKHSQATPSSAGKVYINSKDQQYVRDGCGNVVSLDEGLPEDIRRA